MNYLTQKKKKKLSQCLIKCLVFDLNVYYLKWTKSYLRILNLKPQLKNYELAWSPPRVRRQPKYIIRCNHK